MPRGSRPAPSCTPIVAYVLSASFAASCADCDSSGCDALSRRAPGSSSAIGGVVAVESDVVVDGCAECGFGQALIELWRSATPITDPVSAAALANGAPADEMFSAVESYLQPVAPGDYLFCVRSSCVGVHVTEGETSTVNIAQREGPTRFLVGVGGEAEPDEVSGFEIGG